jgi:tetratricopeptide (TPR) repeat protein
MTGATNVDDRQRKRRWRRRRRLRLTINTACTVVVAAVFVTTIALLDHNCQLQAFFHNNIQKVHMGGNNKHNNYRFERYGTTTPSQQHKQKERLTTRSKQDQQPDTTIVFSKIRYGMRLSEQAKNNVTAAEEACSIWEEVLPSSIASSSSSFISPDIISLSKTLYASCLVRVGRDGDAISVYDSCLDNRNHNDKDRKNIPQQQQQQQIIKWRLAKAQCLQRLLRYTDAAEEYIVAINDNINSKDNDNDSEEKARTGAATCIVRSTGNITRALDILLSTTNTTNTDTNTRSSVLLSYCLDYIETGKVDRAVDQLNHALTTATDNADDEDALLASSSSSSSSSSMFLLYRWILAGLRRKKQNKDSKLGLFDTPRPVKHKYSQNESEEHFMELIRINTSPLDDPNLVRLDDKIELHNLLSNQISGVSSSSWPEGYILPDRFSELEDILLQRQKEYNGKIESGHTVNSSLWISKSRSGYGSHGNRLLTHTELSEEIITSRCDDDDDDDDDDDEGMKTSINVTTDNTEPYLLQRMIDPLLLLQGYKFSLRIYVVYFSTDEVYISSKGLVKLASLPLLLENGNNVKEEEEEEEENPGTIRARSSLDASMHMTNSGRETFMQQHDLDYLWTQLAERNNDCRSSSDLWVDICNAAANTLLVRFPEFREQESAENNPLEQKKKQVWKDRREEFGIPKILGLDFVVDDTNLKPWLVEVNRFPGLEPRDEMDSKIKYQIVRDAWMKAIERLMLVEEDHAYFNNIFESLSNDGPGSSLQRLSTQHSRS